MPSLIIMKTRGSVARPALTVCHAVVGSNPIRGNISQQGLAETCCDAIQSVTTPIRGLSKKAYFLRFGELCQKK